MFSNPLFLWALLAVPLPVLLHLFFKRRKARVIFSTLQFFHVRKRELAHRRRLREWLLLACRTLAMLCLALALARPFLQRASRLFASRTDIALVLDDTLSMARRLGDGATAFDFAVARAGAILDTLPDNARASLLFLSGQPGVAAMSQRQALRQALESARVTGATGSYASILKEAAERLAAGGAPNKEVYVLSDFQRNQFPDKPIVLGVSKGLRVYFLPIDGPSENLAVTALKRPPRPCQLGKPFTLAYTLRNTGGTARETDVRLVLAGETRTTTRGTVPAGQSVEYHVDVVPERAGILSGELHIEDGCLTTDNARFFAVTVCENIRTLLLESDLTSRVRPFYFLKRAIDPIEGEALNGIETETGFMTDLAPRDLDKRHAVLLANPTPIPAPAAALLERYMTDGGTVLVFAGDNVTPQTCAAFSHPALRALFGPLQEAEIKGLTFRGPLSAWNDSIQMGLLKGSRLQTLHPSTNAVVLAESGGHPILIEEPVGAGRLIACALSCRRDTSNWPELKSYPVVLIRLLTYAAHDADRSAESLCGAPLRFTPLARADKALTLRLPDGTTASIPVKNNEATCESTGQPGLVTAEHAIPRAVALNPVPEESDLTCQSRSRLAKLIHTPSPLLLRTDADLASQVRALRRGSDLTGLLLALALCFLLSEIALIAQPTRHTVTKDTVK